MPTLVELDQSGTTYVLIEDTCPKKYAFANDINGSMYYHQLLNGYITSSMTLRDKLNKCLRRKDTMLYHAICPFE